MNDERVFEIFKEIAAIPRPSGKEEAITAYLESFAERLSLPCIRDEANNIIIKKDGTKGMEDHPVLILQSHTDMVCEQTAQSTIDMDTTGITVLSQGDFLFGDGTSLGADDGIGMAMMLAILESKDIPHPPLECLFTATEETGLLGALAINPDLLKGQRMINLDSEDEHYIFTGCAGGGRVDAVCKFKLQETSGSVFKITLSGLVGGHSGTDIDKSRGNANRLLIRLLQSLDNLPELRLIELEGGSKDNAIPRESFAVITLPEDYETVLQIALRQEFEGILREYKPSDPDINYIVEKQPSESSMALSTKDTIKLLSLVNGFPQGVQRMSPYFNGIPETSLNLGILSLKDGTLSVSHALRSVYGSAYDDLKRQVTYYAKAFGCKVSYRGEYPGWAYSPDSELCSAMVNSYKKLYKKDPVVTIIHAGLECGIIKEKMPKLDIISIGPDIIGPHSPSEKVSISSTKRVFENLVDLVGTL